jgi:hypothetical protein
MWLLPQAGDRDHAAMTENTVAASHTSCSRTPRSRISASGIAVFLANLILLGGLATLAASTYLVARCHARAPVWDMWAIIDFWAQPIQSTPVWLWTQHNEHRILLAKLVLLLDYRLFSGRDVFTVTLSFVTVAVLLGVLLWTFRVLAGMRGMLWRSAAAVAVLCLFSTAQWLNFVNGFQIAFFQVELFFALAAVALLLASLTSDAHLRRQWMWAVASVLAGAAATYSMANGMLVWPVLIGLAALKRHRKGILLLVVVSSAVVVASYFFHYQFSSPVPQPGALRWLHQPIQMAIYVINYIGAPLDWGRPTLAIVFGLIGLAAAVFVLWRTVFSSNREPLHLLLASLLLFVLGSAVITALGRLQLGTEQALSARYQTVSLLLWLSLAVLLLRWCAHRDARLLIAAQLGLLAVMGMGILRFHSDVAGAVERKTQVNTASLALITGVFDPPRISVLFPNPLVPWRDVSFLKRNYLSFFSSPLAQKFNQPLPAAYRIRPEPCWGDIATSQPIHESEGRGLRLSGWAWDPSRHDEVRQIVFAAAGKIVGYGEPGFPAAEVSPRIGWHHAAEAGWVGYIEELPQSEMVTAYAVTRGLRACIIFHEPASGHAPVDPVHLLVGSVSE